MKLLIFLSLMLGLTRAHAYQLPDAKPMGGSDDLEYLQQISKGVSELASKGSKAIVFVSVSKTIRGQPFGEIDPFEFFFGPQYRQKRPERKQKGLGSGFFVDLDKGYVITNNHVIDGADEISLKLANGKTYEAKVLGRDKNTDVAVVQINDKDFDRKDLKALTLGNSDEIKVGEMVIALGAPFGLESSLSFGVLSARGRGNLNITTLGNFMQTDAAINPGNSGGPLLSTKGEVIGMNTAIYSRSGSSAGIGFAVPANLVRNIANQLISKGDVSRGYLGVRLQPLDEDIIQGLGLPEDTKGILIAYVQPEAPAKKAGLSDGDVITAIDGTKVASPSELTNAIGLLPPGTKIKVTYYRDGKVKNTTATLDSFPGEFQANKRVKKDAKIELGGLFLKPLGPKDKKLRYQFKLTSRSGLLVTDVERGSKADLAGFRPGDLILKANRQRVTSVKQFKQIFNKSSKTLIHLERAGDFLYAALRK